MTITFYSEPQLLPAGLGLAPNPARRRRSFGVWLRRLLTRIAVRRALVSARADLASIPSYVLIDMGIAPDDIDHAGRIATLLVVRRAIRTKLRWARRPQEGYRWRP